MRSSAARRPRPPHLRLVTPLPPEPRDDAPTRWIEVSIQWGSFPLRVAHLEAPTRFVIDEALAKNEVGFVAPVRELGLEGGEIVVDRDGVPHARVPASCRDAWFTVAGGRTYGTSDGVRHAVVVQERGATLFALLRGRSCRFDFGNLTVEVAAIEPPPQPPPPPKWWRYQWLALAVSLVFNAIVVFLLLRG